MALPLPSLRIIRRRTDCSWYIPFVLDAFICRSAEIQVGDIIAGLDYMHSLNVVHGDLKAVCDTPLNKCSPTVS
jgi:serine/threonine protein kinase